MGTYTLIIKVILLIVLTYLIYNTIKYIQQSKSIEKSVVKMFSATEHSYKARKEMENIKKIVRSSE